MTVSTAKLQELSDRATSGTCHVGIAGREGVVSWDGDDIVFVCACHPANAAFIAACVNYVRDMLAKENSQ